MCGRLFPRRSRAWSLLRLLFMSQGKEDCSMKGKGRNTISGILELIFSFLCAFPELEGGL